MKKKILSGIIALMLAMTMFGCGNDKENEPARTERNSGDEETEDDAVVVSSLDEFLDAIEPGAVIEFKKGSYDFTPDIEKIISKNKKFNKEHDYVQIEECFDGYQIVIMDIDDLTIRGAGKNNSKVELMVEPRYADVLSFVDSSNITISNMTIGHTIEQGSCCGDVLEFDDCENIELDNLDLYGCGTYGITSLRTDGGVVSNTVIRDCGYGIISFNDSDDWTFDGCKFINCEGYTMLDIYNSSVKFSKCEFKGNDCDNGFITDSSVNDIKFKGCSFGFDESEAVDYGYYDFSGSVSYDSKCSFTDESDINDGYDIRDSYSGGIVTVGSIEELLYSVAPYTQIVIEPGYYNITDYIDSLSEEEIEVFNEEHEYVSIEEEYDGYEIVFHNLTIIDLCGGGESAEDCEIVTDPRYAAIFTFDDCLGVNIMNLTLGHTDTGDCDGNVIDFFNTYDINIHACDLYGCGVYGLGGSACGDIFVNQTIIRDCKYGVTYLSDVDGLVKFNECKLYDSEGGFYIDSRDEISFTGCYFGAYESYSAIEELKNIELVECEFSDYDWLY